MLDATLLKVTHNSVENAHKALPYIQKSDIFAVEQRGCTETDAIIVEKRWKDALTLSRAAFQKFWSPLLSEYNAKIYDYIFRAQIPLVFLERWPGKDGAKVVRMEDESLAMRGRGFAQMADGKTDEATKLIIVSFRILSAAQKMRDEHIAHTLSNIEVHIRAQNSGLQKKETINLTFSLGSYHTPEQFSKIPITVVDLAQHDVISELGRSLLRTEESRDSRRDAFAYGIGSLMGICHIRCDPSELQSASIDQLKTILHTNQGSMKAVLKNRRF